MSSRRTLILVGAIAIGLVAVLLVVNYVRGIEDRANNNAKRVDVYVARTDIPRGTAGEMAASDGSVGVSKIPQEFRPASAITTTDEIQKKVALFNIPQNTPIVQDMFVDPAQAQISFRERLKNPDHVAITVSVDQVRGVAGFLVPGDEVNMMVIEKPQEGEGATEGGFVDGKARYLFQKVQILAVGQSTLLSPGEQSAQAAATAAADSGLITFNVPPEAAAWIASAQNSGSIYLSLVPEDYVPRPLPPIDTNSLPGESGELTPYGPQGNQD